MDDDLTIRWFLANKYKDPDEDIDRWARDLTAKLTAEALTADPETAWQAIVVPGRDDFHADSTSFRGDGDQWAMSIGRRANPWTGRAAYDGVVVPVSIERGLVLGKPTDMILMGFLQRPDHVGFILAYNVGDRDMIVGDQLGRHVVIPAGDFVEVVATRATSNDPKRSFATWSRLVLSGEESRAKRQAPEGQARNTGTAVSMSWSDFVTAARQQAHIAECLADVVPKASEWASGAADFLNSMAETAERGSFVTARMIDRLTENAGKIARWTDNLKPGWMDGYEAAGPDVGDGPHWSDNDDDDIPV